MMKTRGNFVDRKCLVFDPEPYVSQEPTDSLLDFRERTAEIGPGAGPIFPCPFPCRIEHSAMKFTNIKFIERVSLIHYSRVKGPSLGLQDILPLPLVKFSFRREVGDELSGIVRMERRITRSSVQIGNRAHCFLNRRCVSWSISFET